MKLASLISKVSDLYGYNLTRSQVKDIHGRLRFAEVDVEHLSEDDRSLAIDTIVHVAKQAQGQPKIAKTAAVSCPRCSNHLSDVKLAEGEAGQYCTTCRVVVPGR